MQDLPASTFNIPLNPKTLTSLVISNPCHIEYGGLCALLGELPYLTSLAIDAPVYFSSNRHPDIVELHHLRFLRFRPREERQRTGYISCGTLSTIRAPLLVHLTLGLTYQSPKVLGDLLESLPPDPPAYSGLQTLILHCSELVTSNLAWALASAFPDVTSLRLFGCLEIVLETLVGRASGDSEVYWKCLQELVLDSPNINFHKLTTVVRRRKEIGRSIGNVRIEGIGRVDGWICEQPLDLNPMLTCREVQEINASLAME
ncbi:hypothetical protein SERLA73DRAFT_182232 [Serpula lacrymans var. lacrymans S7.3]|uniref:F-box domain-containing protein n=1 Tax=Serpula lacrymans var. lacrymans (strain S7.3) TaxID=936435 RepID=F8PWX6_SERL3|nr:hypothetical protein SERLA73DRAFT_182232 [Serpula lacrymans var. lacrymans S7.3]